jgi:hypothetical protein
MSFPKSNSHRTATQRISPHLNVPLCARDNNNAFIVELNYAKAITNLCDQFTAGLVSGRRADSTQPS